MVRRAGSVEAIAGARDVARSVDDSGFSRGTVIADRYRLDEPIGCGGTATIWAGTHLALQRAIAVKLISLLGTNSAAIRDRFLREARVAAAVHHRNVVHIVDFGATSDGRPFMVMELLRGRTLADRLGEGPVGVPEAVQIMACVLSGLAAVHDAGILHRDLKPENVFLVDDPDGAYPKLLDFGISRALDPDSSVESVLKTRENAIVGTPQYMSPEQARGIRELDHRSDLWAVGVMFYELLAGELPFDSEAVGDVLIQVATAEPPKLEDIRPDLPECIGEIVAKSMRRQRDERYGSAREMREALLAAAAFCASELRAQEQKGTVIPRTYSDLPPPVAGDFVAALDDAYEAGDSAVFDGTELDVGLPEAWGGQGLEPSGGAGDSFERASQAGGAREPLTEAPTDPSAPLPPSSSDATVVTSYEDVGQPGPDRRKLLVAGAGAFLALVVVVTGVWAIASALRSPDPADTTAQAEEGVPAAQEEEPTAATRSPATGAQDPTRETSPGAGATHTTGAGAAGTAAGAAPEASPSEGSAPAPAAGANRRVTVTLVGLPRDAQLRVDGHPARGAVQTLPRDGFLHRIVVTHADGSRWATDHRATGDGRYQIPPPPAARRRRTPTPPAQGRSSRSGTQRADPSAPRLRRDPGF